MGKEDYKEAEYDNDELLAMVDEAIVNSENEEEYTTEENPQIHILMPQKLLKLVSNM